MVADCKLYPMHRLPKLVPRFAGFSRFLMAWSICHSDNISAAICDCSSCINNGIVLFVREKLDDAESDDSSWQIGRIAISLVNNIAAEAMLKQVVGGRAGRTASDWEGANAVAAAGRTQVGWPARHYICYDVAVDLRSFSPRPLLPVVPSIIHFAFSSVSSHRWRESTNASSRERATVTMV